MSARNATPWETIGMGIKLWLLALAVTLFLPVVLLAMAIYGLCGGKLNGAAVEQAKADFAKSPTMGPWSRP